MMNKYEIDWEALIVSMVAAAVLLIAGALALGLIAIAFTQMGTGSIALVGLWLLLTILIYWRW